MITQEELWNSPCNCEYMIQMQDPNNSKWDFLDFDLISKEECIKRCKVMMSSKNKYYRIVEKVRIVRVSRYLASVSQGVPQIMEIFYNLA